MENIEALIEICKMQFKFYDLAQVVILPETVEEIEHLIKEYKKKDMIIEKYDKECRQFKAFCRRVRRNEKHDVDEFNQGQEHKCNQFLNLLNGDENWEYEGKYFNETDEQINTLKTKQKER